MSQTTQRPKPPQSTPVAPEPPAPARLVAMREQVYVDPRPKAYFDPFHARVRRGGPDWVYEAVRLCTTLYCSVLHRTRAIGAERVPGGGPVILAPNHFSFMDHFFVASPVRRKVQFMGKSHMFTRPLQFVYSHGGVFPVRRGQRDGEVFVSANAILGRDGCMAMYCEGGRSRTGQLAERPKRGIGRLALESGAIVVPVAIHGSSRVRNWKRLHFPKVTVKYGEPLRWDAIEAPTLDQQQAVADEIYVRIRALYETLDPG